MEKRTVLAIALSVAIIVIYQYFFVKPLPVPPEAGAPSAQGEKQETKPSASPPASPTSAAPAAGPQADEIIVRVETDLYTATLSSKGGVVNSWSLKKYEDSDGLSVGLAREDGLYPALGIGWGGEFPKADFTVKGGDMRLDEGQKTGSVVFEYASAERSIRRTYTFHHDSYGFDLKDEVSGVPEYELTLGGTFGIYQRKDAPHAGPVLLIDTKRIELNAKDLKEPKLYAGNVKWIAEEDMYFFAAIIPKGAVTGARAWSYQDSQAISFKVSPGVNEFKVYAGPKEHDMLKGFGSGLEHIIDFGFFSIIARPIFWALKNINGLFHNYGWSIVLLTIIVRIPFIPIMNKGQKAMKRLQELQPRMQEIREKHKKDPKRMQQEMMELYGKHKVNPMSGCLPILIQMPVFFALYKVLLTAIELRGAPFMLWITDLSIKDPYYILPIVMGATMVIQQKMTPSAGDPKQQKLMMFMPVIFTFLFLNFASGLVLYWLVNNLLSIAQQVYANRKT